MAVKLAAGSALCHSSYGDSSERCLGVRWSGSLCSRHPFFFTFGLSEHHLLRPVWSECVGGLSSAQKPLGLAALALRDEVQRMSTEAPTGHTAELNLKLLLSDLSAQNTHLVELPSVGGPWGGP